MKLFKFAITLLICLSIAFSGTADAYALKKKRSHYNNDISFYPGKYAALVINTETGSIVHQENADSKRYPASLTKLMTLYLTFEALKYKKIRIDDYAVASRHSASQPKMGIGLEPGERISIRNLISSLVVVSANDSAVTLAEKLGGTEQRFAALMTKRAQQLGMSKTNFINASGLFNKKQVTTAKDMARLMMALKRDFPRYYPLLSQNEFSYNGMDYGTHTALLKDYKWAKAAKTGYVKASGFNLVVGAEQGDKDLVAVVMGGVTAKKRDNYMKALLDKSFTKIPDHAYASAVTKKPVAGN